MQCLTLAYSKTSTLVGYNTALLDCVQVLKFRCFSDPPFYPSFSSHSKLPQPVGLEQVEYHMFPKGKQLLRNQHVNLLLRGLVPRRVNISASRPLGRACDSSLAFKAVQRQSCQTVLSTGMKVGCSLGVALFAAVLQQLKYTVFFILGPGGDGRHCKW